MVGLLCALTLLTSLLAAQAAEPEGEWVYLENASLRLGVLRSSGAAMAFLAPAGSRRNLLNHFDRGRLVQQSYYGKSDGSLWVQQPWRYNPVQGGDYRGAASTVEELRHDATTLYARTTPRHWATGATLPECTMEQWLTLREKWVEARFQLTYRGTETHPPQHQEIPAVFVDAELSTLVMYDGDAPWTGGALTRRTPGPKNEYYHPRENWVAYVDKDDCGLGVYVPIAIDATCYRYLGGAGSDCSYVAPITTFALTPGLKFSYSAYFAIGKVAELRQRFAEIRTGLEKEKTPSRLIP